MARSKRGGRVITSTTPPQLSAQQKKNSTETKYFGLVRDEALSDLTKPDKALDEVLTDIQDPAEASTLGKFVSNDLQVINAAVSFDLKREDFEILENSSINAENAETGRLVPLINPRQRIDDRIKQFEGFAGRGTIHQGQGTVLFKYVVEDEEYNHTNPPPFYTLSITSTLENAPDYIPSLDQVANTHRLGFIKNGVFVPTQESEWWWNGEYNHEFRGRGEYSDEIRTALTDPKYPIVRDGNLKFEDILPEGISSQYNWGLRFDTWFKRDFSEGQNFMRWVAQVNGHVRIDYFDRTGYDEQGAIQGTWKVALDTTNPSTYYTQLEKEEPTTSPLGARFYYIQGGPETPLGSGTGTLPSQNTASSGGALDLNATFSGREEDELRSKFNDDYVPVVIRFWYGRPNEDETDPLLAAPFGPASLTLDMLSSDISEADLPLWNDYSAQILVEYNSTLGAWQVPIESAEINFDNFAENFEILAHGTLGSNPGQPATIGDYFFPEGSPIIATKVAPVDPDTQTRASFSLPGINPGDGEKIWVIAKNRPWTLIRASSRTQEELWQSYLFSPNPFGRYESALDLLDGVGENYAEPDPIYTPFEENKTFYKAKYVKLPALNTYGPDRYGGMIRNSLTTTATQRDYDYLHTKLLLVGRQKKDISLKPLAPEEVRENGENYTFIEVVKNEAGRGGNIVINAYPTNNLSVLSTTTNNAQLGNFLHMGDNIKTFNNPSKQNISIIDPEAFPATGFPTTARLRYVEFGDQSARIEYVTWNGSAFISDTTGVIANLPMGTGAGRDHDVKSAFLSDFVTTTGVKYSFYGLIGLVRPSLEGEIITVNPDGTISGGLFSNSGSTSNNDQYIGTEIVFGGDATVYRVTAYNALESEQKVTITPSKAPGTYSNSQIWYNHFTLGSVLPSRVVNDSSVGTTRSTVLSSNGFLQAFITYNGAYQYTRVDNGSSLSFSETLYSKLSPAATPSRPFVSDSELPAPPADIVVPFGYDNTPSSSDPGLGGLCYPPYSIQNVDLQNIVADDTTLYTSTVGNYDMWWGSKSEQLTLGGKSLKITNKLLLDIDPASRDTILSPITNSAQKPTFDGSEYTHKLEIELSVELPEPSDVATNAYLFEDAKYYSNNKPVKDKYYLFINNNNSSLEALGPTNPGWT